MMVANSFDLWQKDAFFTAAEEVQESADVMQSAYRMWIREKKEGLQVESLEQLTRDLQTALGTAKWQLEEFERAVRVSYGHRCDDITASRHNQFVSAIESQIAQVEEALREAFIEEGKQPLHWVNLNKEECDDLALFLSGTAKISPTVKNDLTVPRPSARKDANHNLNAICSGSTDSSNRNDEFSIDVGEREISQVENGIIGQADKTSGARKTWSSLNFGALRIVIADKDQHRNRVPRIEATTKEKVSKPFFWKQRCGEHSRVRGSSNLFNQFFELQRQLQSPLHPQFNCSIQLTLALMLSIFLIVPFLLYSD